MPTTRTNKQYSNSNSNQIAYAKYVGDVPTAPSSNIFDVTLEAEADTAPSTFGTSHTPLVNATYVGKVSDEKKDTKLTATVTPFSQALGPQAATAYLQPTTTTATTTTAQYYPPGAAALTGNEVLALLKEQRKCKQLAARVVGGVLGGLLLGPIGALALGWGQGAIVKSTNRRRERVLRAQYEREGRLDQPVAAVQFHFRRRGRRE
jgi:hypothetical protein